VLLQHGLNDDGAACRAVQFRTRDDDCIVAPVVQLGEVALEHVERVNAVTPHLHLWSRGRSISVSPSLSLSTVTNCLYLMGSNQKGNEKD
jgi:hypothetical protein